MKSRENEDLLRTIVDEALAVFEGKSVRHLRFVQSLEELFEQETRKERSHRMWFEGVLAILGFNLCLLADHLFIHDGPWVSILHRTTLITPVALAANLLVRRNPPAWLREGSIALSMLIICLINMNAQGTGTTAAVLFGVICLMISALFIGVVMRLRFLYASFSVLTLWLIGIWSLGHSMNLQPAEVIFGQSMISVALGIILIASHSLEREQRRGYLLCLQRDLRATHLTEANKELHLLSSIDKLTGLPNRRALEERVTTQWAACAQAGSQISAVVIDVDKFKAINDANGHLYGDETLHRIGTLLPQALRSRDDLAARYGGEEFVLLLPHATPDVALLIAERVRKLVETAGAPPKPVGAKSSPVGMTVSCGVSTCFAGGGTTWSEMLGAADGALYLAKRSGRNRVEFQVCEEAAVKRAKADYYHCPHGGFIGAASGSLDPTRIIS